MFNRFNFICNRQLKEKANNNKQRELKSSFDAIPKELIFVITSYLDLRDIFSFALTDKKHFGLMKEVEVEDVYLSFLLLSMSSIHTLDENYFKKISEKNENKPILIKQDKKKYIYGCVEKKWQLTELENSHIFRSMRIVKFPRDMHEFMFVSHVSSSAMKLIRLPYGLEDRESIKFLTSQCGVALVSKKMIINLKPRMFQDKEDNHVGSNYVKVLADLRKGHSCRIKFNEILENNKERYLRMNRINVINSHQSNASLIERLIDDIRIKFPDHEDVGESSRISLLFQIIADDLPSAIVSFGLLFAIMRTFLRYVFIPALISPDTIDVSVLIGGLVMFYLTKKFIDQGQERWEKKWLIDKNQETPNPFMMSSAQHFKI